MIENNVQMSLMNRKAEVFKNVNYDSIANIYLVQFLVLELRSDWICYLQSIQ